LEFFCDLDLGFWDFSGAWNLGFGASRRSGPWIAFLELGIWSFSDVWNLVFGVFLELGTWDLVLSPNRCFSQTVPSNAHLYKFAARIKTVPLKGTRPMKTFATLLTGLLLAFSATAQSSVNIVGYYNLPIHPGENLIANQLSNSNNTLNAIFNPTTPVGSTYTRWDPVAQQFAPVSTYAVPGTGWTINYSLNFGEGGLLTSPIRWTNTFVGEVTHAYNIDTGVLDWHPNYANGLHLISSPIPLTAPIDVMFPDVVGRLPQNGEWVGILNPETQLYTITTFHTGSGWDNGNPILSYGQSAWFDLGGGLAATYASIPTLVPEPNAIALAVGAIATLLFRRSRTIGRE